MNQYRMSKSVTGVLIIRFLNRSKSFIIKVVYLNNCNRQHPVPELMSERPTAVIQPSPNPARRQHWELATVGTTPISLVTFVSTLGPSSQPNLKRHFNNKPDPTPRHVSAPRPGRRVNSAGLPSAAWSPPPTHSLSTASANRPPPKSTIFATSPYTQGRLLQLDAR